MPVQMQRRQWLKSSALAIAGAALTEGSRLVRPAQLSARRRDMILLDQNENPYGISGRAQQAIMESTSISCRYPGVRTEQLRDMIARHEDLPADHVILGAGSTEIFSLAVLAHGADGKEVLMADPGYFDFKNYVQALKGRLVPVPLDQSYEHDLDALSRRLSRKTRLVYICNPNNPTSTIVSRDRLRSYCEEASRRTVVLVDEAYCDLVEDSRYGSMLNLVKEKRNLIVTRTFSKIHGLAGLRIGYGIAKPELIQGLRRIQTNFAPISIVSLAAAAASYDDREFIESCRRRILESRADFCRVLEKHGCPFVPSHANFVIFQVSREARQVADDLRKRWIQVRPFEFFGKHWIRASIGTPDEMQSLAAALPEVV